MQTPRFRETNSAHGPRRRILVVDDSSLSRKLMVSALSQTFDIDEAADGLEAIGLLKRSPNYACVVTDDQMPGASGIEVLEYVKSSPATKKIPVVIITAGTELPMSRHIQGHVSGAAVFMNKPIVREQLLSMVVMAARSAQQETFELVREETMTAVVQ